jgi:Tol biopolymer transport system component
VAWSSGNVNVATVSVGGVVTAVTAGATTIRALVEGVSREVPVTVAMATVESVDVSSPVLTLEEGESRVVTAVARDAAGRALEGRVFSWTSADPTVATVDGTGRITALRIGTTRVTTTTGGTSAEVQLTVQAARVAQVTVQPRTAVLEIGESRQMSVILRDARGRVLEGRPVQWSVIGGTTTITQDGLLTGMRNGYATINATVDGVTDAATGTIVLGEPYAWDLLYHREANGNRELFTYRFGADAAPVRLNAGTVSFAPTASGDGTRIAFAVHMTDLTTGAPIDDIFAVDRNGLNMRRLTTAPEVDDAPAWSPTAPRIAWLRWIPNQRADVWVMNADGTGQVNLTADLASGVAPSVPAWSPDGTRIAFAEMTSGAGGTTARIWTMRADGTDKRIVTGTTTGFDASPSWSADGTRIAFLRHYMSETDITIVGSQGGATTRVSLPGNQWNPSWSPDGQFLAFHQSVGGRGHLFTVRPDGTGLRLRTVDPAWGGGLAPAWIRRN